MDYKKEEFVRIITYKTNIIRDNATSLLKKYQTKEQYEQFLKDTLHLLEEEKPFFILDDSYKEKVYTVIAHLRFEHKDKELNNMANAIITELNTLSLYKPEAENEVIDAYICYNEDVRELVFSDLEDFLNTIAQDYDLYVALMARDITTVDDIIFIGGINIFMAECPDLFKEPELLKLIEARAKKIKSSLNVKTYKKMMGAKRLLSYLEETKKKNQE